jgi:hypothetical protein
MQIKYIQTQIHDSKNYQKNQFMIVQTLKRFGNLNRLKQEIELYQSESQIWTVKRE